MSSSSGAGARTSSPPRPAACSPPCGRPSGGGGAAGGWLRVAFLVGGTDLVAAVPQRLARRVSGAAGVTVIEPPFGTVELVEVAWWHPMHATDPALTWLRRIILDSL